MEEKVNSDHQPLTAWIKGEEGVETKKRNKGSRGERRIWTEKDRKVFGESFVKERKREENVNIKWKKKLKENVEGLEKVKRMRTEKGREKWWEECMKREKREWRLKSWRRNRGTGGYL